MARYVCIFTNEDSYTWDPPIPASLVKGDTLLLVGPANFCNLRFVCSPKIGTGAVTSLPCNGGIATYNPTSVNTMECNLNARFSTPPIHPEYDINVASLTLDNP